MKTTFRVTINNISFFEKEGKHTAILKGFQTDTDMNGNKVYEGVSIFIPWKEDTKFAKQLEIIAAHIEDPNNTYKSAMVEGFSVKSITAKANEFNGKTTWETIVNTNYVRLYDFNGGN